VAPGGGAADTEDAEHPMLLAAGVSPWRLDAFELVCGKSSDRSEGSSCKNEDAQFEWFCAIRGATTGAR